MKNCYYLGDLEKDIKKIKRKSNFNWKNFMGLTGISILAGIIGCGIVALIIGKITSATIGSFLGIMLANTVKNIKQVKRESNYIYEENHLVDFYKQINDQYSKPIPYSLAKSKLKDCIIQTEKVNDVKKDDNNKVISKTEKVIKYFYLLDPSDRIQVLRHIKEEIKTKDIKQEYVTFHLLEDSDIEVENLEIPVIKTLKLKDKNNRN